MKIQKELKQRNQLHRPSVYLTAQVVLSAQLPNLSAHFLHNWRLFLHHVHSRRFRMNPASSRNANRNYWLLAGIILLGAVIFFTWTYQSKAAKSSIYKTTPAALGVLTSNVGATGIVRAAQSTTLVWNTNGRVEQVNVAPGEKVNADQVLASLAEDSMPRNILLAKVELISAQQNLDSLSQSNSSRAKAMLNLSNANQQVKDAQDAFDNITRKRVSDELIKQTLDQLNQAQDQLKRTEYIFNRFFGYEHMADGRPAKAQITINITSLKQNIANLTAKYNWYTSKASPLEVEKYQAALKVALAIQEDAQREMERVQNGTSPEDIAAAKARVAGAQATVDLSKIIAPFNGTITKLQAQAGDRAAIGQVAFRLDDLSKLMVDMQISEVDINNIATGQPVTIVFDAIPDKTYNGVVSKVNQATKAGQGGVNFGVTVTITDGDELVKPGMTASVTITVKQVGDALLVPNAAIRLLDGQRIVYILKNEQPVAVIIRLGATADNYSQVVGGDLREGDLIIENPPVATNNIQANPAP